MLKYFFFLLMFSTSLIAQDVVTNDTETVSGGEVVASEKNLDLAIGIDEIVQLDYKFSTKVQIGNESLVKLVLTPSRQEVTFKGIKPGKTSVTIRDTNGEVRDKFIVNITSSGKSQTVTQLRELIGDVEGLDIGIKGDRVYVAGELVVPDDIGRVATVLGEFPDVLKLVEISPHTQRVIARKMQDELAKNGMKDVSVRVVNKVFWLEGVVNSKGKSDFAMKIAEAYVPPKWETLAASSKRVQDAVRAPIMNFISVNEKKDPPPPSKQVKISAQFVELAKDYKRVFGFKWAPLMTNSGTMSFGKTASNDVNTEESGTLSGTISQLFPKLATAKEAGYARIIQSGMVITKNEVSANIKKTQQIPYSIGTGEFQQKGEANLTFDLSVKPVVQGEEKVELQELSISVALPSGVNNQGIPITTNNSVKTNITVKNKESAAIGGIVQNSSTTAYDKNDPKPYGDALKEANTSMLFNFIRSKGYVTSKSQFVVFVTPEIIESASNATEEIRKKFKQRQR